MYDVLRDFGSYLSFTLRFTGYLFFSFTSFSLSNSIVKKLYSTQEISAEDSQERENFGENSDNDQDDSDFGLKINQESKNKIPKSNDKDDNQEGS